jgi:adenylate cyclase class IV
MCQVQSEVPSGNDASAEIALTPEEVDRLLQIEVESKYAIARALFPTIEKFALEAGFNRRQYREIDNYLITEEPDSKRKKSAPQSPNSDTQPGNCSVKLRVRRQERADGTFYLLTRKQKLIVAGVEETKAEEEHPIDKGTYEILIRHFQAKKCSAPLIIEKNSRTELKGIFEGLPITLCLDIVFGTGGIVIGDFVEIEVLVKDKSEIAAAQTVIASLAKKILPKNVRIEKRGYRKLLLAKLSKERSKEASKRPSKQRSKPSNQKRRGKT